eukprot:7435339-Pyramimonas_sp.AAC.1
MNDGIRHTTAQRYGVFLFCRSGAILRKRCHMPPARPFDIRVLAKSSMLRSARVAVPASIARRRA